MPFPPSCHTLVESPHPIHRLTRPDHARPCQLFISAKLCLRRPYLQCPMTKDSVPEAPLHRPMEAPPNRRHGRALHPFRPDLRAARTLSLPRNYKWEYQSPYQSFLRHRCLAAPYSARTRALPLKLLRNFPLSTSTRFSQPTSRLFLRTVLELACCPQEAPPPPEHCQTSPPSK